MVETHRACLECDMLHEITEMHSGEAGYCQRCGAVLFRSQKNSLDGALAFALTGLIFFFLANLFPLLEFEMQGNIQTNRLIDGSIEFFSAGYGLLGLVVLLSSVVAPMLILLFLVSILLPLKFHKKPFFPEAQIRLLVHLRPWAMAEIFVLGIIVAYVKLGDFADVSLGVSLFSFVFMVLATLLAYVTLDMKDLWYRLGELQKK
ncbi:MAG: paraquat-inducible protein A [Sneathiella sp.]|nr:paraquat-inducible protein A [Sneathiella sp.]